jgi:hypothetical protein
MIVTSYKFTKKCCKMDKENTVPHPVHYLLEEEFPREADILKNGMVSMEF